jgi:4-hydroxybenzoate polyprenyltransferase/geranylgeranylglycerol-phosphate geranylgeranyltransferase
LKTKTTVKVKLFAHLETWRLYTVIWCGLVSLAGSCIAHGSFPSIKIALLALFVPMMGWTAALYLSDFLDRKLDAIQKPHRPIPSGRIKPLEALIIGATFAVTGFILSFLLSIYNILLVFVVAILVFSYTKISKSHGLTGNINRGIITVAAYLYGIFSAGQTVITIPIYIWLLSLVFLFHDANSNLVGAIRDMEGDKEGGYITIPVKYGIKNSIIFSLILTIIWYSILFYLVYLFDFVKTEFYYLMFIDIILILVLYVYLIKSLKSYNRRKALRFHEFFVIERIVLASALIFGKADLKIAMIIFLTALLVTLTSQVILRKRYEFKEKTK